MLIDIYHDFLTICRPEKTTADLVDLIFEAQDLGEGVQHVDGEAFIPLRLSQDVLRHHDERIFLQAEKERTQTAEQVGRNFTLYKESE